MDRLVKIFIVCNILSGCNHIVKYVQIPLLLAFFKVRLLVDISQINA